MCTHTQKKNKYKASVLAVEYFLSAKGVLQLPWSLVMQIFLGLSRVTVVTSKFLQKDLSMTDFSGVTGNVCVALFTKVSLSEQIIGWTFLSVTLNTYSSENSKYSSLLDDQRGQQIKIYLQPLLEKHLTKVHG